MGEAARSFDAEEFLEEFRFGTLEDAVKDKTPMTSILCANLGWKRWGKKPCRVIWSRLFFFKHLRANLGWYSVFISPQTSGNPAILHNTLRILTGDVKMLRFLTESRADINARTQGLGHLGYYDSMTPLMIATRSNQRLGFKLRQDWHVCIPWNSQRLLKPQFRIPAVLEVDSWCRISIL